MNKKLETWRRLYTLLPRNHPSHGQQPEPDRKALLENLAPDHPRLDVRPALEAMRAIKSEEEIHFIQKAVDATIAGHRAAWRRVRPGLFEYQVMAAMIGPIMDHGCIRVAYAPIIGSGFNATVLHYADIMGRLMPGDLVLMDVGGEYRHYAADITRTVPAGGRFTARQREIYDAVLGAQKAAIQAVKPGMTLSGSGSESLEQVVRKYLDSLGKDSKGETLSQYLGHGLGHHVGLEVHDPGSGSAKLQPGMVITIEPGLYLPDEKIGVRIEDMLLVTETGARVLSSGLPSDAAEIERVMSPETSVSSGL
jgi:Xaa-Pro aminopeptidase